MNDIRCSWEFDYPITKNNDWSRVLLWVMLGIDALFAAILIAIDPTFTHPLMSLEILGITAGALLIIFVLSYLLMILIYGKVYHYSYQANEDMLLMQGKAAERRKESAMVGVIAAATVLAAVSGKSAACGTATLVGYAAGKRIRFRSVRRLRRREDHNAIDVRGFMTHTTIYACPEDYENVWNYMVTHCPKAQYTAQV